MAFSDVYHKQAALLVRLLPSVAAEDCFAMKGGTAINLFIRDMPRLSVDIDLTYLPVRPRPQSLAEIDTAMGRIGERIVAGVPGARATASRTNEGVATKLLVRSGGTRVKIEVTPVLRGCVFGPQMRDVAPSVEEAFGFAEARIVSFADLYAGKIVAALDRQHPRDLFDVRDLLANEGIDDALRQAFVVYLLSHDRPMAEVLTARPKDITTDYVATFAGMTSEPVALDALLAARDALVADIVGRMPDAHRQFLVSFERGAPEWPLLGIDGAAALPAILWRQRNLDILEADRRAHLVAQLERTVSRSTPREW